LLQSVGQSFGLTSLVWFALKHLDPSQIFTFGALLQTGRLFGAQLGSAFVQTFVRTREQTYSNLIGLHINTGSLLTDQRLQDYAKAVADRSTGEPQANARAIALLARSVQNQAYCSHTLTASWFSASPSSGPCCSCCCFAIRRHTTASMVNSDRAG
jgi:DHA2 family multidrug resistance protein